jgi:UDP-GlcNAc:undecaprenyl-phosphate GlcNAc-1-phosphate transferase
MPIDMPALAVAFLLSVVMVEALRRLSPALGLLDRPSARKAHVGLVPVSGGLAMFGVYAALLAGWVAQASIPVAEASGLVLALVLLVAVGVFDDRYELRPTTRLACQAFAAIVLCFSGMAGSGGPMVLPLEFIGAPHWLALLISIVFVVGCVNAFNMADGLDGLAGGLAATALACIAIAAMLLERPLVLEMSLLLLAVVLGFLVFNMRNPWRRSASVFMGDAGSMMLGCAVAAFVVSLSSTGAVIPATTPGPDLFPSLLWLVALPVIDTLSLMVRRPWSGHSPMAADRRHLHHLLIDRGHSPASAALLLVALAAALGAVGLVGVFARLPAELMAVGLLGPALMHCAFVRHCSVRRMARDDQPFIASPEAAE